MLYRGKLVLLLIITLLLVACSLAGPTGESQPQPTQARTPASTPTSGSDNDVEGVATALPAQTFGPEATPWSTEEPTGGEIHVAARYPRPPGGHYNTFAAGAFFRGAIYHELLEMPLALYEWERDEYIPALGAQWQTLVPDGFTVRLREDVQWSDGSRFTSRDVLDTFTLLRLREAPVWDYLSSVEAMGEYEVSFKMATPSRVALRYILREPIRASSVYGEWAERAVGLFAEGLAVDSPEMEGLRARFERFRPARMVVSGPFEIDPGRVTPSVITLTKVATAWNAPRVNFDRIVVYNKDSRAATQLALNGRLDYVPHASGPASNATYAQRGLRVVRTPSRTGPALLFNYAQVTAVEAPAVRHALAMAVNRDENATVSAGKSAQAAGYMVGVADAIAEDWLPQDVLDSLNRYEHDPDAARAALEALGFAQREGVWVSPGGERMEYELLAASDVPGMTQAAKNLAAQLTRFGVRVTVRPLASARLDAEVNAGRFELALGAWGAPDPHPYPSYARDLLDHNPPRAGGPGAGYKLQQETLSEGEVDLERLTSLSSLGLRETRQSETVSRLARAFNELLPIIPLWERLDTGLVLPGVRVTGWPPEDSPIYNNHPDTDNFVVLLILDGTLRGVTG